MNESPLQDPRRWPKASHPLHELTLKSLAGNAAARAALKLELDALFESGTDGEIRAVLNGAPSPACYRHLQEALAKLVNKPERGETLIARLFALPLVIVAGARKATRLPDALPDVSAVTALLSEHGVTGADKNVGLGNALVALETLACVGPKLLREWASRLRTGGAPLELAGTAVTVNTGREQVHLRFLIGASIVPAHVPTFIETGAHVGAWGMPLTKLLVSQLAADGLELLPMARAPKPIFLAGDAGRAAQVELAFTLFLSNAVRDIRRAVGDPSVVLSAHQLEDGGAELRVSLSSPFDEGTLEGFRWPLHPADEVAEIINKINNLLLECQVPDVSTLAGVVGDLNVRGGRFFNGNDVRAAARPH
jgi:hypothetical protein